MEATDPVLGLRIARSDVVFLHDTLMSCAFQGAQMLQASALIHGFARALAQPAPAAKPEAKPDDPSLGAFKKTIDDAKASLEADIRKARGEKPEATPPVPFSPESQTLELRHPRVTPGGKKRKR